MVNAARNLVLQLRCIRRTVCRQIDELLRAHAKYQCSSRSQFRLKLLASKLDGLSHDHKVGLATACRGQSAGAHCFTEFRPRSLQLFWREQINDCALDTLQQRSM